MKKTALFILPVIILATGIAFYLINRQSSTKTTSLPQLNMTADIPQNWQKEESSKSASFYINPDQKQAVGHLETGCKIELSAEDNLDGLTQDSLIQKLEKGLSEEIVTLISKQAEKINIAGRQAVDWTVETEEMGFARTVYIFSGNRFKIAILYAAGETKNKCQEEFSNFINTINLPNG